MKSERSTKNKAVGRQFCSECGTLLRDGDCPKCDRETKKIISISEEEFEKEKEKEFKRGIIVALSAVEVYDADVIHQEIVDMTDEEELVKLAKEDDALEYSGLDRYVEGSQ